MDDAFGQALARWTAYYQAAGGIAGTYLGLVFAALTLRREIFLRPGLAYVRDFAAVTLGALVSALLVTALVLAPHDNPAPVAVGLLTIAGAGLAGLALSVRQWARSPIRASPYPEGWSPRDRRGQALIAFAAAPFVGLAAAAAAIAWTGAGGLGLLALVQVGLLLVALASTWSMVAQAEPPPGGATPSDPTPPRGTGRGDG